VISPPNREERDRRLYLPAARKASSNTLQLTLLCLSVMLASSHAFAANHPPVTGKNTDCASCHADMLTGTSVHSQGEIACTICHAATPDGNTVTMSLTLPKQQLCFACHARNRVQQNSLTPRRECLYCHDAHRSPRTMLLRRNVPMSAPGSKH
jgi:Cytochrome c7 and related cytochrome c